MSGRPLHAALGTVALLISGCVLSPHSAPRQSLAVLLAGCEESPGKTVYVVGHGWHTGVVLRRCDVSPELWPESGDFHGSDFLEVGWGDEGFYRAKKITLPLVLRAAFWSTPSVLHVAGLRGPVEQCFPVSDVIEVHLSGGQFDDLCRFISATFARDEALQAERLGPGLYAESLFYRAKGEYYLPKTCNVWTAQALRAAGCPVIPAVALTAENVLFQARRRGRVLQQSARGLKKAALGG